VTKRWRRVDGEQEDGVAKLLYSATMSLDGYIAGPGGDMSWMRPYLGPDPYVDALVDSIGSLLVGGRTYRGDDPYKGTEGEGEAFGGGWSGPQIVLTSSPPDVAVPGVTFVGELDAAIGQAREAAGEKYVNVLGACVARQCLQAGELDEVLVSVAPVLLGDGVRLFDAPGGTQVRLERLAQAEAPNATDVHYRVLT
jgi:dihydrofolate reductase